MPNAFPPILYVVLLVCFSMSRLVLTLQYGFHDDTNFSCSCHEYITEKCIL